MGTRNLTLVQVDGALKVAQYGQWDGYPSGQGATVLKFMRDLVLSEDRVAEFTDKVRKCHFMDAAELAEFEAEWKSAFGNGMISSGNYDAHKRKSERFYKVWPQMTRDTAAEILSVIMESKDGIALHDNSAFAADSLFCEWAYCVNLDTRTLEVYSGFNHEPLADGDRFVGLPISPKGDYEGAKQYYPIRCVKTFSFDDLPTEEEFVAALEPKEEEAA